VADITLNTNKYDYLIAPTDTDSISFCKPDGSGFSEDERKNLLKELNSLSPEFMIWEDDGYFPMIIAFKAKNYVLYDGKKIKKKGSSLKDPKSSPALREFLDVMIDAIVFEKGCYTEIYNRYVREILHVQDIKRWSSRKTLSSTMMESERTNETRVLDALVGSNYVEGDRFYTFFETPEKLTLVENFSGVYDQNKLLAALHAKSKIFNTVIPGKELFINYALKKNQKLLSGL
jgi:hypothetical protein